MTSLENDGPHALTATLTLNPGACHSDLATLRQIASILPNEYLAFLSHSNGAEGPIGEKNYLVLWSVENILAYNTSYGVDEFAPGLFLFGTDGGSTGYGFDGRSNPVSVVEVPLAGLDWSEAQFVAPTFQRFLQRLHEDK